MGWAMLGKAESMHEKNAFDSRPVPRLLCRLDGHLLAGGLGGFGCLDRVTLASTRLSEGGVPGGGRPRRTGDRPLRGGVFEGRGSDPAVMRSAGTSLGLECAKGGVCRLTVAGGEMGLVPSYRTLGWIAANRPS